MTAGAYTLLILVLPSVFIGIGLPFLLRNAQEVIKMSLKETSVTGHSWLAAFAILRLRRIIALIRGIQYLVNGPQITLKHYQTDVPYTLDTLGPKYVHLSSREHMRELARAPENVLSLHALSKEMLQPKYTMNGLDVEDSMRANGSVHTRVLQSTLSSSLPHLTPTLRSTIATEFSRQFSTAPTSKAADWKCLFTFGMAKRLITFVNSHVFFGSKLSSNEEFVLAAEQYLDDLFMTAEVLRLVPGWCAPWLAPLLMRKYQAMDTLVSHMVPEIQQRIDTWSEISKSEHVDCIQFFVDASRQKGWTAERIAQVLMGMWFASVHQPAFSLVYALEHVCAHREQLEILRNDVRTHADDIEKALFLDAFMKESARLSPSDAISGRRQALRDFTFSDGTTVRKGDVACISSRAIMQDESYYSSSTTFDPSRFMNPEKPGSNNRFIESGETFPLWGIGRRSCPGRDYAARMLKLVMAHLISTYDIVIPPDSIKTHRTFTWRSAIVPKDTAALHFRRRALTTDAQ